MFGKVWGKLRKMYLVWVLKRIVKQLEPARLQNVIEHAKRMNG